MIEQGCIFDDLLCEDSKEWIISVVRHDDVGQSRACNLLLSVVFLSLLILHFISVPRVTQHNLEKLREEFFDVVARIKVPKYQAFHVR